MIAKNIKKRYNVRSDRMSFKIEINPELKMKSDIMFKAFYGRKENDKVKRAVENYEVLTGDEEVKRLAEIRLMSKLEEKSALDCAREEGLEQGLKRGKKEIAQKLKKQKMPAKQIAEITGLSEVEIENLK